MKAKSLFFYVLLLACAMFIVCAGTAVADDDPIEVEGVINIVGNTDSSNVADAIKKANEILGQAGIKVVPVKVNSPYSTGNGDPNLTSAEGDNAVGEGEDELDDTCGSGNGIKINVGNDVWVEKPGTSGWSIHRRPVVFAEPHADANTMGRTIAHEICHSLTLNYDLYDANDANNIMYGYRGGGTTMTDAQKEEIRKGAKKRVGGWWSRMMARIRRFIRTGRGYDYDPLNDLTVNGVDADISGFVELNFLDIRSVSAFCENPDDPGAELIVEIQPQGYYPVDSFFDITYNIDFDTNGDTIPDGILLIHVNQSAPESLVYDALYDAMDGMGYQPVPMLIHENEKHYSPIEEGDTYVPILANHSIEVAIPLDMIGVTGTNFLDGIGVHTFAQAMINAPIGFLNPGDMVVDDTPALGDAEGMVIKTQQPCECSELEMIESGRAGNDPTWPDKPMYIDAAGCDFSGAVELFINDEPAGIAPADADGKVSIRFEAGMLERGTYEVMLKEVDDTPDTGAHWSIGYLDLRPVIEGDIDDDGHVNFEDFARLANNWLVE